MVAIAKPADGMRDTHTVTLAHTAAVVEHEIIVSGGNVLVAVSAAEADEENVYICGGRVFFPKGGTALASVTGVFFDESAEQVTTSSTDNTRAGTTAEASVAGDDYALVMLRPN